MIQDSTEHQPLSEGNEWRIGPNSINWANCQDENINLNNLYVADCRADDGPMLNNRLRWRPGPQGRAMPYAKKTSHLTVRVSERLEEESAQVTPDTKKKTPRKKTTKEDKAMNEEMTEEMMVEEMTEI